MSDVVLNTVTAYVSLRCDTRGCQARWRSEVQAMAGQWARDAAAPAWQAGWRLFAGQRTTHVYCPQHGPKTPMRQERP